MAKSVKKNWEIILPAPLVLDSSISDEDIIAEMASVSHEAEVSSILSSAFEVSKYSYTVTCTKEELFDLLTIDAALNFNIELQEYEDMYVMLITDENDNIIGRGEICESGRKVNKEVFRQAFLDNFSGFKEKFDVGQKRMNSLAYKLKALRNGMINHVTTNEAFDKTSN